jgi:hypothetical protein
MFLKFTANGLSHIVAPYVCGTLRDDCHPYLASCTDRENGNYVCECIEHYIGNGKTCQGMDS